MGKFKSYILVGACGLLLGGAAVFLPFDHWSQTGKALLFVGGYLIWDACYTIANVPYGSMLSLVSENNAERAQLSTWRAIGSMIGNILPTVILPMLIWQNVVYDGSGRIPNMDGVFHNNPLTNEPYQVGDVMLSPLTGESAQILLGDNVFWAALIMGLLGFLCFLFMIRNITIRVDENSVKTNDASAKVNIFRSFGKFMTNRPAVGCTLAAMGMFLGMQSATTANAIMFATYFGMAKLSGLVQMIGFLPMFLFIPFIKKIVNRFGKKEASVWGTLVSLIGGMLMLIFPIVSDKSVALVLYLAGLVVYGVGMGIYTCVSWAMMSDAIDYNEWKFGVREEGTVYALHSFFRKLAQGIGPSVVLLIMGLLGYNANLGTIGQSAATAHNMCWLVAILYLFSAVLQFVGLAVIYNLDKKTVEKMNGELTERRADQ